MGLAGWLTLAVVVAVAVAMARERLGPDLVMFLGLSVLVVAGVVDSVTAIQGFANPALVTIACLFVVASSIQETGALTLISRTVFGKPHHSRLAMVRLLVPTSILSGFVNNTPIVAMLVPVVHDYARKIGQSPSRYLMPLSYAAMLGGTLTLVGTSGNLVVSGMLIHAEQPAMGMFEIAVVGLPTLLVGMLYLLLVGPHLMPRRVVPPDVTEAEVNEYMAEVMVARDSPLVGRTIEEADLRHLPGLFLVEIRRDDGLTISPVAPEDVLMARDQLVFTGLADTVQDLRAFPGLVPTMEPPSVDEELYEVVVSHRSDLIGRTVRAANFRRRFDAVILAVHRAGERIESKIGDIELMPGDTLMITASPGFRRTWRHNTNFYLVSQLPSDSPPRYRQANLSLVVLVLMVLIPALTEISMLTSAMGAVTILLLTGCISPRRVRTAINWSVLVVIGAAFGIAEAMASSGTAAFLADSLLTVSSPLGPLGSLAALYLLAVLMASLISNAAGAALVFPVAFSVAASAGLDPRPFAIMVAMGASAVFSTPMSYANLIIYGPGGYRYTDFLRLGLPLNLLVFGVAMAAVPWFWPLLP